MANTITSPNMMLPVPVVGVDPGPDYATNINASLNIIDSHNHSVGQGVQINPNGIDINADLPFNSNNATSLRSSRYTAQNSALSGAMDLGCTYVSGVDLWYNDENGNQIQITASGSVNAGAGSIGGLPSGTASVAYSGGTYTFLKATLTPAAISVGPITLAQAVSGSKTVSLLANGTQGANYNITFPSALPGATNYVTLDSSGNLAYNANGSTGSGANVLATSPTIASPTFSGLTTVSSSGIAFTSGTMVDYGEGTWTPTVTNISNVGSSMPNVGRYQIIGNYVYCSVVIVIGITSQSNFSYSISLPVAPANNFSNSNQGAGLSSAIATSIFFSGRGIALTSAKAISFATFGTQSTTGNISITHTFSYITNT